MWIAIGTQDWKRPAPQSRAQHHSGKLETAERETWLMVSMIVIVGLSAAIISVQLGLPA